MPTSITVRGKVLTLSPDQDAAIDKVFAQLGPGREACLAGAAGTGKTTVMAAVLMRWKGNVIFMAPTGKAANRLREQTGMQATTIHSAIFGPPAEEEEQPNAPRQKGRKEVIRFGAAHPPAGCYNKTLVVVDESSMVNMDLGDHLRRQVLGVGGALLWVGDHEQLPPVEGTWGAPLQNATATLTEVHRQALESPVLELATLIRQGKAATFSKWGGVVNRVSGATIEQAVAWAEEGREADALLKFVPAEERLECKNANRVLLTWTNAVRTKANRIVRQGRGYPKVEVQVGETLLCTYNNHTLGIMNGEAFEVQKVEDCEPLSRCIGAKVQWVTEVQELPNLPQRRFLVLPQAFDAYHPNMSDKAILRAAWAPLWAKKTPVQQGDESANQLMARMGWSWDDLRNWRDTMMENSIQATWGYCLTTHKSQGSQWSEVGFISCPAFRSKQEDGGRLSPDDRRRMTYTAVTRAESGFTAFMLDTVPNYSKKNPYGDPL
jgi:exodeoxyribonuclease-5